MILQNSYLLNHKFLKKYLIWHFGVDTTTRLRYTKFLPSLQVARVADCLNLSMRHKVVFLKPSILAVDTTYYY
jgi:hypothetical protein